MPLPRPRENEKHEDFMARCMSDEVMQREYGKQDQRYAVCEAQWSGKEQDDG